MATCREVHMFGIVQCNFFEAENFGNQAGKQPGRTVSNWQHVMRKNDDIEKPSVTTSFSEVKRFGRSRVCGPQKFISRFLFLTEQNWLEEQRACNVHNVVG